MKRIIRGLMVLVGLIGLVSCDLRGLSISDSSSYISTSEDILVFTYLNDDDSYQVTGYIGTPIEVIIPSTYNSKSVTSIGNHAFEYCSSLTSINIPNSVTSIGYDAFSDCSSITNITLDPTNPTYHLLTLGEGKVVTTSTVWNNNSTVVAGLAYGNITMPNNIKSVEEQAFYRCSSLISIVISNSVTSINEYAFAHCSSLTTITIS
ncbi:MAG: leucine-rich repeat domain-containing protein, partial [Bacillales bacterium]|nr:leucine-rich repeat domain-containing protein [Bacillales bacterium]